MTDVVPDKVMQSVINFIPLRRKGQPEGQSLRPSIYTKSSLVLLGFVL